MTEVVELKCFHMQNKVPFQVCFLTSIFTRVYTYFKANEFIIRSDRLSILCTNTAGRIGQVIFLSFGVPPVFRGVTNPWRANRHLRTCSFSSVIFPGWLTVSRDHSFSLLVTSSVNKYLPECKITQSHIIP